MPVGRVEYLDLGPMTFTEFLRAVGQERLAREIETFEWPNGPPFPMASPHRSPAPAGAPASVPLRRRHARGGQGVRRIRKSPGRRPRARQHHRYLARRLPEVRGPPGSHPHAPRVQLRGPPRGTKGQVQQRLPGRPERHDPPRRRPAGHGARHRESDPTANVPVCRCRPTSRKRSSSCFSWTSA